MRPLRALLLAAAVWQASARPCSEAPAVALQPEPGDGSPVILTPPSEVFPRLELGRLLREPDLQPQLDLFMQAYAAVQARPAASPVSYYQLAGIHGQPYQAWDNVTSGRQDPTVPEPFGGTEPGRAENFAGYCWHASVLFPTWHRAYTLLMEQEVRKEAFLLAQQYSRRERPTYLEAARQLRFPYWDWTSEEAAARGLPEYVLQSHVTVRGPAGNRTIRNPLESFTLPADVANGAASTARGQRSGDPPSLAGNPTLRHPDVDLQPQIDRLQNDLTSELTQSARPAWFKLYTDPEAAASWGRFATHQPRQDGRRPATSLTNIEGIHDLVHDVLGGIVFSGDTGYPGHMSDVDTAAFDPLFFLHHANVDRLTALYQAKNPGTWIAPTEEPYQRSYMVGTGGFAPNSSTPLWPFRKAPDAFWTSDDVRDFTALGYTYPDFLQEQAADGRSPAPAPVPASRGCTVTPAAASMPTAVDAARFRPDDFEGFRWYLNFRQVPRSLCGKGGGSTMLSVFLQTAEEEVLSGNATLFAGSIAIFGHSSCEHGCHEGPPVDGQVDLTQQLVELGLVSLPSQEQLAPPGTQPGPADSPPSDLLSTVLRVIISCAEAQFEMDAEQKAQLLSLCWGRLLDGYQIVGAIS